MTISVWAAVLVGATARADEPFLPVDLGSATGYIVPEKAAAADKAGLTASMPGVEKIDGFWTPTEANARQAERALRETLERAAKDPSLLFPDLAGKEKGDFMLELERDNLNQVLQHYDVYGRQYAGIILMGKRLVFCNYADVRGVDFSRIYISMDHYFATDGVTHFLLARFDPEAKTCANISMIGPWRRKGEVVK